MNAPLEGWSMEALREAMQRELADIKTLLEVMISAQIDRIEAMRAAAQAGLDALERSNDRAHASISKRLDQMNDFRASLADQAATFITRDAADARLSTVAGRVDTNVQAIAEMERQMASMPTGSEHDAINNAALARDAALGDRLAALELRVSSRLDLNQGRINGASATFTYLISAGSLVIAIAAVILSLVVNKI